MNKIDNEFNHVNLIPTLSNEAVLKSACKAISVSLSYLECKDLVSIKKLWNVLGVEMAGSELANPNGEYYFEITDFN